MLKHLNDNKAQAIAGEYLLVMFLVVGMVGAMTLYFRRALQARIHDARYGMITTVQDRAGSVSANFVGNLYRAYEPYYANAMSTVNQQLQSTTRLSEGGYFRKEYNDYVRVESFSVTAPPANAY